MDTPSFVHTLRQQIHSAPELSLKEVETTRLVCQTLTSLGLAPQTFDKITGATAWINKASDGPCLGFRADMDALPIQEENQVPYRSKSNGIMHACGHDANTAIMLGVAKNLSELEDPGRLKGPVKFIFQPAEERGDGAKTIIEKGAAQGVDRVLAGHMAPDLECGKIGIYKTKGYAAADLFHVTLKGVGGHGGRPHETCDPIVAGAYFVSALQTLVARNTDPTDPAVITVGKFQAGTAGNIIPATAAMEGTIRTHSKATRDLILKRLEELAQGLESLFGVKAKVFVEPETPCCTNDLKTAQAMYDIAQDLFGPDNVIWLPPTMGSEDFAFFAQNRPAVILRLGCANRAKQITAPLHSPMFDIDEKVLDIGTTLFTQAALTLWDRLPA